MRLMTSLHAGERRLVMGVIPPDIPATTTTPPSYSGNFPIPSKFGQPGQSSNDFYQPRQFQVAARVSF